MTQHTRPAPRARAASRPDTTGAARAAVPPGPRVLAVGMGWLPEQPGGLNRVFFNLARALPEAGVAVRGLVAARVAGGGVEAFAPMASPLPERLLAARSGIVRALAEADPDLVASHFALYTAPALDRLRARPLVVHFHGPWAAETAAEGGNGLAVRVRRAVERAVYRRADRLIVLSEAFRDVAVRDYGVHPDRVRIVPGGVEAARFALPLSRVEARDRLGWPQDRPVVLAVRRLAHRMGLENLVDATAALRRAVPDVLVLVAGGGRLAGPLQERIAAAGLGAHVRLLGFVPDADLPLAYRAADLSVVPTAALEGFGLVAAESLAAGTPALVTPVGGLPEVVRGLAPGLVLPGSDAATLADGLAAALTGRLPLPTDEACRRWAAAHYDWSVVARQTRAVYEEAL